VELFSLRVWYGLAPHGVVWLSSARCGMATAGHCTVWLLPVTVRYGYCLHPAGNGYCLHPAGNGYCLPEINGYCLPEINGFRYPEINGFRYPEINAASASLMLDAASASLMLDAAMS